MKHTPGPWDVNPKRTLVGRRVKNGSLDMITGFNGSCYPEDNEANAYLISAAPNLLRMCKTIKRRLLNMKLTEKGSPLLKTL